MLMFLASMSLWIVVFCMLYLVYVILFGLALGKWHVDKFGYCYRYKGIATSDSSHPKVDQIYLGITCLYMFALLSTSYTETHGSPGSLHSSFPALSSVGLEIGLRKWFVSLRDRYNSVRVFKEPKYASILERLLARYIWLYSLSLRIGIVCVTVGQYLLHLYMVWAIRSANRVHLQGDSEDTWGFGQVVALIQILPVLKGCTENCIGKTLIRDLHMY